MFLVEKWFWRGFQSAIFYYISWAPCSDAANHRKQRKENKRAKAKEALNAMEEGQYRHPQPFSTNPYWSEEIAVGPGPPARKAARKGKGKPKLKMKKKKKEKMDRELRTGGVGSSTDTGVSSADTMVGGESIEQVRDSSEGWNKKRYQREDEILWGLQMERSSSSALPTASSQASGSTYQYHARNPAINDLHPPVVSTHPQNKLATQWMLQPPPKAQVMAGKERATLANTPTRSRSTSGASYGSYGSRGNLKRPSDMSLGRQVGERFMESKLKQGKLPESLVEISRGPSARSNVSLSSRTGPGQPHDRDMEALARTRSNSLKRAKPPPPPITISQELELPSPPLARPPLSTILSETLPQRHKDRPPHLRPHLATTNSASSLHSLQELVAPSSQLNLMKVVSDPLPNEAVGVKLPPVNREEDTDLQLTEEESCFPESTWRLPPESKQNHSRHQWTMSI